VHTILVTQARQVERGVMFERGRPLVGDGLLTSEGQFHLRQRRLMQPALHPNSIGAYLDLLDRNTRVLADSWRDGQTIDVRHAMIDLVIRNTTDAMFGISANDAVRQTMRRCVPMFLDNVMVRIQTPKFLERFPLPANRRVDAARREIYQVLRQVIAHRRHSGDSHQDLLHMLLSTRDQETGEVMAADLVEDEAFAVFVAGVGTTGATLAWLFHELGRFPGIEDQVLQEVRTLSDDAPSRGEAIQRLDYTRRSIQEILRIHPVLLTIRRAAQPLRLGPVELPPATEIGYSPVSLHRDPRIYPDPLRVDPDRWLPDPTRLRPAGSFIPFGEGRHRCIGEHFAWAQLLTVAAVLLRRWRLRPVPGAKVREVNGVHPSPGSLHMISHAR